MATVEPESAEQVRALLREFHRRGRGKLHVHAISSGYNWGFGSAEPAAEGAVLVDLRRLATIRELDSEAGVVVVEPGVSQGLLAQRLADTRYLANVTASSAHTSVIGNALERGIGLRRQRSEDLIGLEVALADGSWARVGRWPRPGVATTPYAYQPGPGLLPLFAQSNLGIVTAAAVRLIPRTEALRVVRFQFSAERLGPAVEYLRRCHDNQMASGIIKIFDHNATAAYAGRGRTGYRAYLPVAGRGPIVASTTDLLRSEAAADGVFDRCDVLDPEQPGESVPETAALRGYAGDPTANDDMVRAVFGVSADAVDRQGREGWLFCVPVAPFTGAALCDVAAILDAEAAGYRPELTVGHTFNVLPERWVDVVVSIRFRRDAEFGTDAGGDAGARAHDLLARLHKRFADGGYHPYRLDVDRMSSAGALRGDPGQEQLLRRLKATLDDRSVIGRGRYA